MLVLAFQILLILVFLYLLLLLFAYFFAEKLAFPAPKASYKFDEKAGYLWLNTSVGKKICALYLPKENAKYTILYSHGNGEDLGEIMPKLIELRAMGFSVFAYDYCGYGESEGKASSKIIYPCAEAAWDYLTKNLKLEKENIVIFGYSMGSAASSYLAAKKEPRALILMGGFASAFHAILPINVLPWDLLNNEALMPELKSPLLILHGKKDRVVPFWNAKRLFAAAGCKKYFIPVKKAGHYNIPKYAPNVYYKGLKNFINTLQI